MQAINYALGLDEVPIPTLRPGQVLVKVICYGITDDDVSAFSAKANPAIFGVEFSGIAVQVIPAPDGIPPIIQIHDHVLGYTVKGGSMAEYVVCDVDTIAVIPPGISFVEAAAIPDMWYSALQIVKQDADIQKRATIVVFNAMCSRGQAVVKLAQLIGCRRVHCVVDSHVARHEAQRHLKLIGALPDEIVIHYSKDDYLVEIARYDPKGLDAVVYMGSFPDQIHPEMSRPNGYIAIAPIRYQVPHVNTDKPLLTSQQYELFTLKGLKLVGCNLRRRNPHDLRTNWDFVIAHILPKIRNRQIKVFVDRTFNWENTAVAIKWVQDHPEAPGKVVCIIDNKSI